MQRKHLIIMAEVESWLTARGFIFEQLHGEWMGTPYSELSERAIFWARRR